MEDQLSIKKVQNGWIVTTFYPLFEERVFIDFKEMLLFVANKIGGFGIGEFKGIDILRRSDLTKTILEVNKKAHGD